MDFQPFEPEIVELMRGDVAALGDDPEHATRMLLRLASALNGWQAQLRSSLGLAYRELDALLALWDRGRSTMGELGKYICLSPAAVTTLSDRMQAMGYLQRAPDPSDRRRVQLMVTPKFEAELLRIASRYAPTLEPIAASNPEQWRDFASAAQEVHRSAWEHAATESKRRGTETVPPRPRRRTRPDAAATSEGSW